MQRVYSREIFLETVRQHSVVFMRHLTRTLPDYSSAYDEAKHIPRLDVYNYSWSLEFRAKVPGREF